MKKLIVIMLAAICLMGCKDVGRTLPSATGSIYELLVVMDNQHWQAPIGDSVRTCMEADMPCLPQMEAYFTVNQCAWNAFDDMLKPVRNLLLVDINSQRYTQLKVKYMTDYLSHPQAVCRITSPSIEEFEAWWNAQNEAMGKTNAVLVRDWFVRQELTRQAEFYRTFCNQEARKVCQDVFGIDIYIPKDYQVLRQESDFVWICCDKGPNRRDIVIYSYPYKDENTFTYEYLLGKRDDVLGKQITAYIEGSYMGTEYRIFPPQLNVIGVKDNAYCAEVRGLWKMQGGAAMGGPFVQHTRLDEINQRVITAEAFVYAAGQKKRNPYRQNEAILYSIQLPQERNALKEVSVKAAKED